MPDQDTSDPTALIQLMLDIISDQPGAILYRDNDRWKALMPTTPGYILTLNESLMPEWMPEA